MRSRIARVCSLCRTVSVTVTGSANVNVKQRGLRPSSRSARTYGRRSPHSIYPRASHPFQTPVSSPSSFFLSNLTFKLPVYTCRSSSSCSSGFTCISFSTLSALYQRTRERVSSDSYLSAPAPSARPEPFRNNVNPSPRPRIFHAPSFWPPGWEQYRVAVS